MIRNHWKTLAAIGKHRKTTQENFGNHWKTLENIGEQRGNISIATCVYTHRAAARENLHPNLANVKTAANVRNEVPQKQRVVSGARHSRCAAVQHILQADAEAGLQQVCVHGTRQSCLDLLVETGEELGAVLLDADVNGAVVHPGEGTAAKAGGEEMRERGLHSRHSVAPTTDAAKERATSKE
jgi:hypothetical protein